MNEMVNIDNKPKGLAVIMADKFQMEPVAFVNAIKATVMPNNASTEQVAAFLMVAHEYSLNPLTKEIYAFPSRGGIQPIVSIDGWLKMINSHPQFDGMEFSDSIDDEGDLLSVTCRIYRKDRGRHTEATEYMSECFRDTDPWKKWPRRMLRHKAAIQSARYAFSFSGIIDEDEYGRLKDLPDNKPKLADRVSTGPYLEHQNTEGFEYEHVTQEIETVTDEEPATEVTTDEPDSELDIGPTEDADAPEQASVSQGSLLAELPGEVRESVSLFARDYYGGLNEKARADVVGKHSELFGADAIGMEAASHVIDLVKNKDLAGLCEFTEKTENWLKGQVA